LKEKRKFETFRSEMHLTEGGHEQMNRRQMVFLPGAALMAGEAFAQSQSDAVLARTSTSGLTPHHVLKSASKYGRAKYSYKVPKTIAKLTKYMNFLSAFLSMTSAQQQQATNIFTTAISSKTALRGQVQAAHVALSNAVKTNDGTAINQASAAIGALGAQRRALGATANASFYQLLTPAQQSMLSQFQQKTA
jgi:LTXXQ motif family protein